MEYSNNKIKSWAREDRPREKLLLKGLRSLSIAELLSIIIGSGTKKVTAVELAKNILKRYNNDISALKKAEVPDLLQFKGIGEAKAISIVACLEISRRCAKANVQTVIKIGSSQDAYAILAPQLKDLQLEEFWVLLLNRNNRVIAEKLVSQGGVSGTVVDPKIIFKLALDHLASAIILCHNHPSGNLQPSQQDIDITRKIVTAGVAIEIKVLDHLIVAQEGYFSFADEGLI